MPFRCFIATMIAVPALLSSAVRAGETISFARDIRPILSNHCFACHGPDANVRKGDLRLDRKHGVVDNTDGGAVVIPGDPGDSELFRRIATSDPDTRMPPHDSDVPKLSAQQVSLIRDWIEQGAVWQEHWSFAGPEPVEPPGVDRDNWSRNEIDRFVVARLQREGLQPSPAAGRETLIRRVTLDLTGLPPTLDEIDDFLNDRSGNAWEKVVDRLLRSPHYGERMAQTWLEAARYADTDGYQNDGPRTMWPWRDWVIRAYNANMPFDRFTIEQLAGDLLSEPTLDQVIATGFNRNHRYNSEAGLVLEEFLLENAVDRVDTTSTVWMGLTMGCARCHDHKYDPFSQAEYYQLIAYFDKVSESGRAVKFGNSEPWVTAPTTEQRVKLNEYNRRVDETGRRLAQAVAKRDGKLAERVADSAGSTNKAAPVVASGLTHHFPLDGGNKAVTVEQGSPVFREGMIGNAATVGGQGVFTLGTAGNISCHTRSTVAFWLKPDDLRDGVILSRQAKNTRRPGLAVELRNGHLQFYIITRWVAGVGAVETVATLTPDEWVHVALTNDGSQSARGMNIHLNGRPVATRILYNTNSNTGGTDRKSVLRVGGGVHDEKFAGQVDDLRIYNRTLWDDEISLIAEPATIRQIAAISRPDRTDSQQQKLVAWYLEHGAPDDLRQLYRDHFAARTARLKYWDSLPTTMVMDQVQPAPPTFTRVRGVYDQPGEQVEPNVPSIFTGMDAGLFNNRLQFARWLVSGKHPLTARVAVNRYWQMYLGRGLVATPEDFGSQGEPPSHPQLLDWLANRFVESGWDVKAMQKLIVMSATYRQSSRATSDHLRRDPSNRLLSRAPRSRLSAQTVRDQALSVSGLLKPRIGGPSVSPYQPANLWAEVSNMKYRQSKGDDLYRRSLYTIWKRTVAPPTMLVLDSGDRESCKVRRTRTNTPLQALTLLNETAFVEAARNLGQRMMTEGGSEPADRVRFAFRLVLSRNPAESELAILEQSYANYLGRFRGSPDGADELLDVGNSPVPKDLNAAELAACATTANVILNLDEAITRE